MDSLDPSKVPYEKQVPNHSKRPKTNHPRPGSVSARKLELSTEERGLIRAWADRGALYSVPRGCHDDMYWILATVVGDPGVFAVTNDQGRDHWHKLFNERDYRR